MPPKKTAALAVVSDPKFIAARTQGIRISSPLADMVESLEIHNEDDFLEADNILAQIRHGRAVWATKIDPIKSPLKRAQDAAKQAMDGVKALDAEIDLPMERLELQVKGKMAEYRREEDRQIEAAKLEQERKARELEAEAHRKELASAHAQTAQMKARLEQARADLAAQAEEVRGEAEDIKPTAAANSSTRWTDKCRIEDIGKFLASMMDIGGNGDTVVCVADYTPSDGVYKMKEPPLSLFTHPKVMAAIQVELNKIFAATPGVVKSWPGIVVFKDVSIAGR